MIAGTHSDVMIGIVEIFTPIPMPMNARQIRRPHQFCVKACASTGKTQKRPVRKMTPLRPNQLFSGSVAKALKRPKIVGAELINPINHSLCSIPNSRGKDRFAPFAPVLSQPWIAAPSEQTARV
jgi:hypothetical protein